MQKKWIFILILVVIGICAISVASAADDVAATNDAISTDEDNVDEISTDLDENKVNALEKSGDGENLAVSQDDSILSRDESGEKLSVVYASWYKIDLKDTYEISSTKSATLTYYMEPCTYSSESYHFYLRAVDLNGNIVYNREFKGTGTEARNYNPTVSANTFAPGTYVLGAVNYDDNVVMDTAVLKVSGTAIIAANNYNSYYNSGVKMTVTMADQATQNPITSAYITVKFTNTKTKKTVTKSYLLNSKGQASFTPPVGVGTWTVQYYSGSELISASTVQKTATITKASVKIKAYKVTEYKGFKTKLKAKVTSNGKKVNEGTVKFKINGKTYKASVKKGVASKKIKLKKVKKYKYTAKFTGSNFKSSKKAKSKAVLKKRLKTKIIYKSKSVYAFSSKKVTIKVRTAGGKKVKNGKIKLRSLGVTSYATVKNGKAKAVISGLAMKHFKGFITKGEKYKKSITKKTKLKYIPAAHKYKSSKKTVKNTSKFKCPGCGKTSTHYHYKHGYYYTYKYKIAVV